MYTEQFPFESKYDFQFESMYVNYYLLKEIIVHLDTF